MIAENLGNDDKGDEYAYSCFLRYPHGHARRFLLALAGPITGYSCHRGDYRCNLSPDKEGGALYLWKNSGMVETVI